MSTAEQMDALLEGLSAGDFDMDYDPNEEDDDVKEDLDVVQDVDVEFDGESLDHDNACRGLN